VCVHARAQVQCPFACPRDGSEALGHRPGRHGKRLLGAGSSCTRRSLRRAAPRASPPRVPARAQHPQSAPGSLQPRHAPVSTASERSGHKLDARPPAAQLAASTVKAAAAAAGGGRDVAGQTRGHGFQTSVAMSASNTCIECAILPVLLPCVVREPTNFT
jgi:hypothetical protein